MSYLQRFLILACLATIVGLILSLHSGYLAEAWSHLLLEVQAMQRDLHRQLGAAIRAVQAEGAAAAWALVVLSFSYGVFHAAGPGHGKVVISTYILTQESQLKRGLVLSLVASITQGIIAVVVVVGTVSLFRLTMRQTQDSATSLETLSYGLVALVGLFLLTSRGRRLWARRRQDVMHSEQHAHHQNAAAPDLHSSSTCCSGHAHGPALSDLEKPLSWHGITGIIASIGLRPCSGAILVLLVAFSLNLYLAGIAAVFAMSIGTAITVSLIAVLSVYARKLSLRLARWYPQQTAGMATLVDLMGMVGGGVILFLGVTLFQMSWTASVHPLH